MNSSMALFSNMRSFPVDEHPQIRWRTISTHAHIYDIGEISAMSFHCSLAPVIFFSEYPYHVPFLTLQTLQGSELEAVLSGVDDPQITPPSVAVLGIADSPYVVNGAMQLVGRNPLCYWQNKPRDRGKQSFYSCPCPVPSWTRLVLNRT